MLQEDKDRDKRVAIQQKKTFVCIYLNNIGSLWLFTTVHCGKLLISYMLLANESVIV